MCDPLMEADREERDCPATKKIALVCFGERKREMMFESGTDAMSDGQHCLREARNVYSDVLDLCGGK